MAHNAQRTPISQPKSAQVSSLADIVNEHWDVIIIGGGSAGLSAALVLARAQRRVLVFDASEPRNRFAPHMHGVLSRDGYSPLDLVDDGRREVRAVDGVIVGERIVGAGEVSEGFEVVTDSGARATGRRLILATGARDLLPDIPGLTEQWGRGIVACPYCDGYEAKGRAIGVLASSRAGLHKAHMLRSYSENITVFTALAGEVPAEEKRTLEARGMRVEETPVTEVVGDSETLIALGLADGSYVPVDVVFAEPTMLPLDEPLRHLGLDRTGTPFGSWIAVDALGKTSVEGVWAIGNAVNPGALVPVAAGAGVAAALALNAEFVAEEVAAACARAKDDMLKDDMLKDEGEARIPAASEPLTDPAEFWEARYIANRNDTGRVWSGRVNAAVADEVTGLAPGTALELGCGEGADALWLAQQGWSVNALDISTNALALGAAQAALDGVAERITWMQTDLAAWHPLQEFDLVTAAFLHSPVELPREDILRRAVAAVAPRGRLLVVGHAEFPSAVSRRNIQHSDHEHSDHQHSDHEHSDHQHSDHEHSDHQHSDHEHSDHQHSDHEQDAPPLPTSDEVLAALALPTDWVIETNEHRARVVTRPDGTTLDLVDTVLRVRRLL